MAASSACVSRVSPHCVLTLQEALQDQQVGLAEAVSKLLPLCWDSELVIFCIHPLRMESLVPTALQLSCTQASLVF